MLQGDVERDDAVPVGVAEAPCAGVQSGDRRLDGEASVAGGRPRSRPRGRPGGGGGPSVRRSTSSRARPVPVLVDATGAAGQAEPDHGTQAARLRVGRVGGDDGLGDGEGLPTGVGHPVGGVEDRAMGHGEHPCHAGEHDRQSSRALPGVGDGESCLAPLRGRAWPGSAAQRPRPSPAGPGGRRSAARSGRRRPAGRAPCARSGEIASSQATKSRARRSSSPSRERSSASMEVRSVTGSDRGVRLGTGELRGESALHRAAAGVVEPGALGHRGAPRGIRLDRRPAAALVGGGPSRRPRRHTPPRRRGCR